MDLSLPLLALSLLFAAPGDELRALGGAEPAPLRAPHFPRPLDEYVFRNWGVAPRDRIAAAIGARVEDIQALAGELGLGDQPEISPLIWGRSYLTVIRRNWHLLPYPQLLRLLDWDEARLASTLREDDFLWIKLGSLKPRAPALAFEPIPGDLRPRYEVIRKTMAEVLGPRGLAGFRPRYGFLDELRSTVEISRRRVRTPEPEEVSLERGATLALPPEADALTRSVAERFALFLRNVMGTDLPVIEVPAEGSPPPPRPPAKGAGGRIELALIPGAFAEPESHLISVEPGRVRVSAGDGEGLLRGLDHLKDRMEERGGPFLTPGEERRTTRFGLRFLYSYSALYGDPLLEPDLDPYPDGYLEKLSRLGVNGVWLQAVLRNLAPSAGTGDLVFSEPGGKSGRRLEGLKALVARARRYGIGIYLYLNEPRSLPAGLFAARPEVAGVAKGELRALCTSVPEVREFLSGTLARVFAAVPDLAGVFTITMSENLTSCWSHSGGKACPRCGQRSGPEVVAEVNRAVFEGVRSSSARARVIAWDWGWPDDWVEPIATLLPAGVDLMSVSEWSLPITRAGVQSAVGEYSMSAVGPGPRASKTWEIARRGGRKAIAKIQANNTWELSAVPYLPVVQLVAEHCRRLSAAGVDGMMLGWTLGGYPSPNLEAAAQYYFGPPPEVDQAVRRVAARRFGPAADDVAQAWKTFGQAFQHFPFHGELVYQAPMQFGPANLLYPRETGYRATMIGFPYDDLDGWRAIYPAQAMVQAFRSLVGEWEKGLAGLRQDPALHPWVQSQLRAEWRVAVAARSHWRSTAAQAEFVMARREYEKVKEPREALRLLRLLRSILLGEIRSARDLITVCRDDARIGFEASNQYYYVPGDLAEKVLNCRYLLEDWIAVEEKRWAGEGR